MPAPRSRRFNILDMIALVAATAAGLALIRFTVGDLLPPVIYEPRVFGILAAIIDTIDSRLTPLLVCWTLATLLCGVAARGPGRRRRLRSPGMIACLGVVLVVAVETGLQLVKDLADRIPMEFSLTNLMLHWYNVAPTAVLGSWCILGLVGFWPGARGWPDRAGRWIGWTWLLSLFLWEGCNIAQRWILRPR